MPRHPLHLSKRLFDLAWPVVGLNMLTVLSLVVDNIMCGWTPDAARSLEALGYAGQFAFLLLIAMMGVTVGAVALISRAHGAGDRERVEHLVVQSTQLTVVLAVVCAGIGFVIADPLLTALGASPEVRETALSYVYPLMLGTGFAYLTVLYGAVLRAVGNTQLPLRVALAANVINVLLNYGLILGNFGLPALGVAGAAYGTIASQLFAATVLAVIISRGAARGVSVRLRPAPFDRKLSFELFRVGAPASLDALVINMALFSLIAMLGHGTELAVAAHGIGLRVQSLAFVPGMSVSQATAALVGQSLGAQSAVDARGVVRASAVMCTLMMTGIGALIHALAPVIVTAFGVSADSDVGALAILWMRLLSFGMPLVGLHLAFSGALQGAGATWTSLGINAAATLGFQIPLSALLGYGFGLGPLGVWLGFPLGYVVKASLGFWAYRRGRWARVGARI